MSCLIGSLTLIDSLVGNRILDWIKISLRNWQALLHHLLSSYVVVELLGDILISSPYFFQNYFPQKVFIIFCLSPMLWNFMEMYIQIDIFHLFCWDSFCKLLLLNFEKIYWNNFRWYPPVCLPLPIFSLFKLICWVFYFLNWLFNHLIYLCQHFLFIMISVCVLHELL